MFTRLRANLGRFDWVLLFAVLVLTTIGFAMIWSVALSRDPNELGLVKKQAFAFAIGILIVFFLATANYRLLQNYAPVIGFIAILLLVGVLIFGKTIRGTTGWFSVAGVNFQPVEFAKFALVLFLAKYLADHPRTSFGVREFVLTSVLVGGGVGLILLQPDLGSALVLIAIWCGLLFFARIPKRYLALLIGGGLVALILAWFFLASYQRDRILTFLDPSRDPLGRGYNVTQALIAVGAGELTGRGLGFGSQSQLRFLPESQTDFIFAVIAEELGLAGVLVVLAGFAVLFHRMLAIARTVPDDFTVFLTLGIFIIFGVQFVVNVGMNLGLLPVTGIGLPFLSYGGSSLLVSLLMLGVLESIAVRRPLVRMQSSPGVR
ncbi:rod shape-determining protein RodA [Candidatus Uhrbacteria bacterium]|nr:rod shape-determining protein RodA [Candidatus Uhrbacteria bacterium]